MWPVAFSLALLCPASPALPIEPVVVRSEAGHFTVRVAGVDHPEHLNHLHSLELSLNVAAGEPVSGASILLTGQRRYSSTPLPTAPRVASEPQPGRYRVDGVRFHMAGEWRLAFDISYEQIRDRATLDVMVK
jgi:YtkA-like